MWRVCLNESWVDAEGVSRSKDTWRYFWGWMDIYWFVRKIKGRVYYKKVAPYFRFKVFAVNCFGLGKRVYSWDERSPYSPDGR